MQTICLWSGPRNVSTALMYSFAERPDTSVVDEPLYGHYLRVSGADHPGADCIMAAMDCDGDSVMRTLLMSAAERSTPLLFVKHMAHHLLDLDLQFLQQTTNIFLIRDPREMLPSLKVQLPHAELRDTGLETQWNLYNDLVKLGQNPAVIDSRQLLLNPESVIQQLCSQLGIDFMPCMLQWSEGARAEDGVWAQHWYHAVHKSTGFSKYVEKTGFPPEHSKLLEECRPFYEKLVARAIRAPQGD